MLNEIQLSLCDRTKHTPQTQISTHNGTDTLNRPSNTICDCLCMIFLYKSSKHETALTSKSHRLQTRESLCTNIGRTTQSHAKSAHWCGNTLPYSFQWACRWFCRRHRGQPIDKMWHRLIYEDRALAKILRPRLALNTIKCLWIVAGTLFP